MKPDQKRLVGCARGQFQFVMLCGLIAADAGEFEHGEMNGTAYLLRNRLVCNCLRLVETAETRVSVRDILVRIGVLGIDAH